ncbi:MAG: radical SAM protein [Gammaproteobacteria bacterium]|nr:radical SAM protein [Gammaproteobacteria bacterium]
MRIAFVSGNREKLPDAVVPLGLLYVMASTPDHHEKHLVDLCFESDPQQALKERLTTLAPDLVALGMRNIQNNDYSGINDNVAYYAGLVAAVREVSRAPVVLGGSGFSVMPAELMRRLGADYGISGEGEEAFPRLLAALDQPQPDMAGLTAIGNLHRAEPGRVVSNSAGKGFLDMNSLPVPDRRLADPRYYERYATDAIQTKRGCPLLCDYCTYPVIEGRVGRARRPAAVVDEMFLALQQQPATQHFFVVDSVFNLPRTHAKNVCRELIARNWQVPWTCYANPLGFDQEMADLARQAGCAGMEIGSDSGVDHVLKRLRKGFTTEDIRRIHRLCSHAGLPDCHTFILGTEGETMDDVRRTLDFAMELDPFSAIIMMWVDDFEALDPALRRERMKLRDDITELLWSRKDHYPHWSIPPLGINFDERLFDILRRQGLHGPLWQHVRKGGQRYATGAALP